MADLKKVVDLKDLTFEGQVVGEELAKAHDAGKLVVHGNSVSSNAPDWDMGDPEETCRALGIDDDDRAEVVEKKR